MTYLIVRGPDNKLVGIFEPLIGCIPANPANTDYQQFKKDIENGAELQDSEGNPMSQEAAIEFVRGLP